MDGIPRVAVAGTSGVAPAAAPVDDDGMQCTKHPYRNNASSNGGICALCLQEKLGNLVSSSNSSNSSFFNGGPSSSLRSDPSAASLSLRPAPSSTNPQDHHPTTRRARIPFLLPHRKKKGAMADHQSNLVLKRSKSAVAPRRQSPTSDDYANSTQKRSGFWSFLYPSKPKPEKTSSSSSSSVRDLKQPAPPPAASRPLPTRKPQRAEYVVVVDETVDDSPNHGTTNATTSSFGRKVSRSRSVGCGSRSFSGDFFERISTGLGDCTLRRVESQREGKRYSSSDVIKEKVRCAGIFGGFMMTSSSSSYWLSAGDEGKESSASAAHGRSRSWGWALASPMRALGRPSPSSSSSTRDLKTPASKSNGTPNLAAIPSLLTAR